MHKLRTVLFLVAFCTLSCALYAQQVPSPVTQQAIAKIVARENEEMKAIRQYSPLVEGLDPFAVRKHGAAKEVMKPTSKR
jgi:hypothetical protein